MIAKHPPMGWNSWDCYGAAVNEEITLKNAGYMREHLKAYGWEYVVVDIQWYQPTAINHSYEPFSALSMDEYGRLLPAVNRFPSAKDGKGFKPLADKIHDMGLKFGIHIMRGLPRMAAHNHLKIFGSEYTCADAANPNSICMWNPDMYGTRLSSEAAKAYYRSIFALYAEWGVDYVKCDDIAREYPHCEKEIELISDAARTCGRDIVLSLSPGPAPVERAEHLKKYANLWRITDDFWDDWRLLKGMFERAEKWCIHAGPGHWPDADMLPVGALRQCTDPEDRTRFTESEQRTMMTLWCMMRSPLMIGAEMTKNDEFTLKLLTNQALLDIEKESFMAHPVRQDDNESVWIAQRKDGSGVYIALFNLSDEQRMIAISPSEIEIEAKSAYEIWTGAESSPVNGISECIAPHDARVYFVKR